MSNNYRTAREHGEAWVCTDCYFAHHYGYRELAPDLFTIGPDFGRENATDREPLALLDEYELADWTYDESDGENAEQIEQHGTGLRDFSWSTCQGCGSTLGGSRSRLSTWT